MLLLDANILLYAGDIRAVNHERYRDWFSSARENDDVGFADVVIAAFLRISTNPRVYKEPRSMEQAIAHIESLLAHPNARRIVRGDRHWDIFKDLCTSADVKGPLVTDAWLAALAIERRCELVSADRDFARFKGLRWRHPLDQ
jgi:toxin-antitoxin system PIN domain toxin